MSTLAQIEAATDALPAKEKQELLLYLVKQLRAQGARLPEPREFASEQITNWIEQDEADLRRLSERK